MHFTIAQENQIMAALTQLVLALLVGMVPTIGIVLAWVTSKVHTNSARIYALENGKGTEKILGVINSKIVDGTIKKGGDNVTTTTDNPVITNNSNTGS